MEKELSSEIIALEQTIDKDFIKLTADLKEYTEKVKFRFDNFDKEHFNEKEQIVLLEKEKQEIFKEFDSYFTKVWEIVKDFEKDKHNSYKKYFLSKLYHLFGEPIELNRHVYTKPLGYAGDYIAMNYTYDYNNQTRKYLGDSSFQKLINFYTCTTPIWSSNIIRKDFLKTEILKTINTKDHAEIASIGSGSSRELLELLKENKIRRQTNFMSLDLEPKALNYVKEEVDKIDNESKNNLKIEYVLKNMISLIKGQGINKYFDLIYVSGVFDYLSDRICSKVTKNLFDLLVKGGTLIVCNASLEKASHRGYYEYLGDWVMIYRTKEEMLAWTKDIENISEARFEETNLPASYWFLSIKK